MFYLKIIFLSTFIYGLKAQDGPDPWNYDDSSTIIKNDHEHDVPPDIRMALKRNIVLENINKGNTGICDWAFRRILAIMLKTGQIQEDGVTVSLQFKFSQNHWSTLNEYVKPGTPISEDVFRRTLGYVEEAIYKPTISEKIIMAWTDYIQIYLSEYKIYITWTLGTLAAALVVLWLWKRMSHKHLFIIMFIILYVYEIFVSYKEAEDREYQKFVNALNACKWYFWTSSCDIPSPDLVNFLKHMNPAKICVRMFTTIISEPMVTLSACIKPIIHDITDGLWWPFNKITYGVIIISLNLLIILLFITFIFNYIFNVPIDLTFGLIGVGFKQRRRQLFSSNNSNVTHEAYRADNAGISNSALEKILDVCSQALAIQNNKVTKKQLNVVQNNQLNASKVPAIKRSSSTGRLPSSSTFEYYDNNNLRQRNIKFDVGGGDTL